MITDRDIVKADREDAFELARAAFHATLQRLMAEATAPGGHFDYKAFMAALKASGSESAATESVLAEMIRREQDRDE